MGACQNLVDKYVLPPVSRNSIKSIKLQPLHTVNPEIFSVEEPCCILLAFVTYPYAPGLVCSIVRHEHDTWDVPHRQLYT